MQNTDLLDLTDLDHSTARHAVADYHRSLRSERVRAVFCDLLRPYFKIHDWGKLRKLQNLGICVLDRPYLERARLFGDRLEIRTGGVLIFPRDVTPELIEETISSLNVWGAIFAPPEVWKKLKPHTRQFGLYIAL